MINPPSYSATKASWRGKCEQTIRVIGSHLVTSDRSGRGTRLYQHAALLSVDQRGPSLRVTYARDGCLACWLPDVLDLSFPSEVSAGAVREALGTQACNAAEVADHFDATDAAIAAGLDALCRPSCRN